jgi:hypothetical protein
LTETFTGTILEGSSLLQADRLSLRRQPGAGYGSLYAIPDQMLETGSVVLEDEAKAFLHNDKVRETYLGG